MVQIDACVCYFISPEKMIDRVKGPAATEVLQGASRANFTHASEGRWEPCRNLDHLIFRLGSFSPSARLSLPSFKPWRTRYEPVNYGISNYWSTCQNVQTKLYKIPKFGINRPKHKQDTTVWKCQNLQRNVWPPGQYPTQRTDAIHFFVNFDVFKSLYLSQN